MSDNEVVVKSGRKIAMGSDWWDIRDNGETVRYVDVVTEARHHHGVFYLSLGSAFIDANNAGVVDIAARLRMDIGTAQQLRQLLSDMIDQALKPVDRDKAN
uniref:hypothetical protein n=1 Tax=Ensifer adhaerens TaxID=106592 RepID=UPI003F494F42